MFRFRRGFMRMLRASLWLLIAVLITSTAWSQAGVGTIRGVVSDPTKAVIPNAVVKLTNTATNVERSTKTNEVGLYIFPDVVPGPYRVTAEAPGLKSFEATITLTVLQDVQVDAVLQL